MKTLSTPVIKLPRFVLHGAALLLFAGSPRIATAQTAEAIAESLFIEGKQLYNDQKYDEACRKLAQSHEADPAGGTVTLLAMCYEQLGRTASAWAKYGEALAMARRDGRQDRAQKAQSRIEALAPTLSYVNVVLWDESSKHLSMEFVLDDVAIPLLINAKVPMDPGVHHLQVRAKGYQPYTTEFEVGASAPLFTVRIPKLEPLPAEASKPEAKPLAAAQAGGDRSHSVAVPPQADRNSSPTTMRTLGWFTGGAGLVALGFGAYFGYSAKHLDNKANQRCPSADCNDVDAVEWNKDARRNASVSTVLAGVGAAALLSGGAMVIFGGGSSSPVGATAVVLPHGGSFAVRTWY